MEKEKYAIFLDIDGTLYDGHCVPEDNIETIIKARKMGHKVFVNTGRAYGIVPEVIKKLPVDGIISGLGMYIRYEGRVLRSVILPKELLKRLAEFSIENRLSVGFEGEEFPMYINRKNEKNLISAPEDFDEKYKDVRVTKFTLYGIIDEKTHDFLEQYFDIFQFPTYVETITKGYSKARGIKIICDYLGVKRENTVAIGDSMNDADMIEYAGLSIAMENAVPQIKRMADVVTKGVSDAGVAYAIENYVLKR